MEYARKYEDITQVDVVCYHVMLLVIIFWDTKMKYSIFTPHEVLINL